MARGQVIHHHQQRRHREHHQAKIQTDAPLAGTRKAGRQKVVVVHAISNGGSPRISTSETGRTPSGSGSAPPDGCRQSPAKNLASGPSGSHTTGLWTANRFATPSIATDYSP